MGFNNIKHWEHVFGQHSISMNRIPPQARMQIIPTPQGLG